MPHGGMSKSLSGKVVFVRLVRVDWGIMGRLGTPDGIGSFAGIG